MIHFTETENQVNLSQIKEIEDLMSLNFPDEYKQHILRYNGGRCSPNVFSFQENGKITSSDIDWFLAIHEGEFDNLKTYIKIYKIDQKRIPSHIIPIAHDSGGNLICTHVVKKMKVLFIFGTMKRKLIVVEAMSKITVICFI